MTNLTLYGFAPSTYVRSARLACVAKGIPHTLAPLDFKSASHFALHPFGKMPVLEHGEVRVFETAAILDYVDAAFDGPALMPTSTLDRARARQWMSATADVLYPSVVGALLADGGPSDAAIEDAHGKLSVLDAALAASPHLVGDDISLADLYVLPMVAFAASQPAGDKLLDGHANLRRWVDALEARAGFSDTLPS